MDVSHDPRVTTCQPRVEHGYLNSRGSSVGSGDGSAPLVDGAPISRSPTGPLGLTVLVVRYVDSSAGTLEGCSRWNFVCCCCRETCVLPSLRTERLETSQRDSPTIIAQGMG